MAILTESIAIFKYFEEISKIPRGSYNEQKIADYVENFAKEHNLKATIGSDFHNKDGLHPVIGFKGEDIRVDEKYIDNLVDWLLN